MLSELECWYCWCCERQLAHKSSGKYKNVRSDVCCCYWHGGGCAGQHGDDGVECLVWGCFVMLFWEWGRDMSCCLLRGFLRIYVRIRGIISDSICKGV